MWGQADQASAAVLIGSLFSSSIQLSRNSFLLVYLQVFPLAPFQPEAPEKSSENIPLFNARAFLAKPLAMKTADKARSVRTGQKVDIKRCHAPMFNSEWPAYAHSLVLLASLQMIKCVETNLFFKNPFKFWDSFNYIYLMITLHNFTLKKMSTTYTKIHLFNVRQIYLSWCQFFSLKTESNKIYVFVPIQRHKQTLNLPLTFRLDSMYCL